MNILWAFLFLSGLQIAPVTTRDVPYPPAAVVGGVSVTVLDLKDGRVRAAETVYGIEPFADLARDALLGWVFAPPSTRKLIALTVFRAPHLYSQGSGRWSIKAERVPSGMPVPAAMSEPVYPANASGDGSVALYLEIDERGAVADILILKPLGGLTAPCIDAARGWRFIPARTGDNQAVTSDALAICVFKSPLVVKPPD